MFGVTDLGLFIVAGLILNITPGVDLLYISSCSATRGRKGGVVAALGIGTGCMVHVAAAACGLSVLLLSSSLVFSCVKYAGAAYLIYLGLSTLLGAKQKSCRVTRVSPQLPLTKIYRQAILINILNPKVALFFMALLPQFVSSTAENPSLAFLFLGLVFNVNGTLINILFSLFTSSLAVKIKSNSGFSRSLRSLSGVLFVALGIRLAVTS